MDRSEQRSSYLTTKPDLRRLSWLLYTWKSYIMLNKAFGLQLNYWPQNILKADGGNFQGNKAQPGSLMAYLWCRSILTSVRLSPVDTFDRDVCWSIFLFIFLSTNKYARRQHPRTRIHTHTHRVRKQHIVEKLLYQQDTISSSKLRSPLHCSGG